MRSLSHNSKKINSIKTIIKANRIKTLTEDDDCLYLFLTIHYI